MTQTHSVSRRFVACLVAFSLALPQLAGAADDNLVGKGESESYAKSLSKAFREASDTALPSVVTILCRAKRPGEETSVLDIIGGPVEQIFDSVGSGVIVEEDGLILTNHHVIENASRIVVRLTDGRQFTAVESKSDKSSDLAIVQIENEQPFPFATLGSSQYLDVGDWVLAIGSPFTLETSVSAGIISGKRRRQRLSETVSGEFLQTDAAINPGNSGGPLIDLDGKVIGINTAISSRNGGFQGIGFAIPIDRANWIKNELIEFGKVRRGYAGVRTSNVTYSLAKELELPRVMGALVNAVVPDYSAANAGLESGDVIMEFSGEAVDSASDFAEMVQQSPIGEPIPMTVLRDGEKKELNIELSERR